jgi:uncharacterized 2Fe-2S/4Fe-4S cluster protein (DUF4445 family)
MSLRLRQGDQIVELAYREQRSLLDLAHAAGVEITAVCGGKGRCTSCRVKWLEGSASAPAAAERELLGEDEIREGFRLSCQLMPPPSGLAEVAPRISESGFQILTEDQIEAAAIDPAVRRATDRVEASSMEDPALSDAEALRAAIGASVTFELEALRTLPHALRAEGGEVTTYRSGQHVLDIVAGSDAAPLLGLAYDLGTTTVVAYLMDLETGAERAVASCLNPQSTYGGDVLSRLAFAQKDPRGADKLRAKVCEALATLADECCRRAEVGARSVRQVVLVGNTAMHHLALGIDTCALGLAPYCGACSEPLQLPAAVLRLPIARGAQLYLPPTIAGFVGSDALGVLLASRLWEAKSWTLAVDIGTNGEILLGRQGRIYACSAPAGPAFEGAQIRCGMRGAAGAIDAVTIGEDLRCRVIGNAPALGLCGSGLVSAAAAMRGARILNAAGRIQLQADGGQFPARIQERIRNPEANRHLVLLPAEVSGSGELIALYQNDIRELQLAKSAIRTGIDLALEAARVRLDQIERLLVAGAFGTYLDLGDARGIGLLPPLPLSRLRSIGNAAGAGAKRMLLSVAERRRAEQLAPTVTFIPIADHPGFQERFMTNLGFPAPEQLP